MLSIITKFIRYISSLIKSLALYYYCIISKNIYSMLQSIVQKFLNNSCISCDIHLMCFLFVTIRSLSVNFWVLRVFGGQLVQNLVSATVLLKDKIFNCILSLNSATYYSFSDISIKFNIFLVSIFITMFVCHSCI